MLHPHAQGGGECDRFNRKAKAAEKACQTDNRRAVAEGSVLKPYVTKAIRPHVVRITRLIRRRLLAYDINPHRIRLARNAHGDAAGHDNEIALAHDAGI